MLAVLGFIFILSHHVFAAKIQYVEPEFLDMLRSTEQDETFAKFVGIENVALVRPQAGRSEEDLSFTTVSELGDVLLTAEQEEHARQGINLIKYRSSKWQNNEIPYYISTTDFSEDERDWITSNLASLNSPLKYLTIRPWKSGDKDYIFVLSGKGCYSNLGRIGGQQTISYQKSGCLRAGTIQHEMIHAAGFLHEHCRPDRDSTVKILWDNIHPDWRSQYEKGSPNDYNSYMEYEPGSVMHYSMRSPGTGLQAFEFYDKSIDTTKVGQRRGATQQDIQKLDMLYSGN